MSAVATVVSITPFDDGGALDESALRVHLGRLREAGVRVYLGAGPGEWYVMTARERRRLLEIGVEELSGHVPVLAMGAEPRSAAEMVEFVRMAADVGVDGVQVYSLEVGHGHVATDAEWEAYVDEVMDATEVPATLPVHFSVGYLPEVETLTRVVRRHDQVVGVNCTPADLRYLARVVDALDDDVEVHVGGPLHALTALALGADGFLNFEGNIAPRLTARVAAAWDQGGPAAAAASFRPLITLFDLVGRHGWVPAVKEVLRQLGLPGGRVRPPLLPSSPTATEDIARTLEQLDVVALEGL